MPPLSQESQPATPTGRTQQLGHDSKLRDGIIPAVRSSAQLLSLPAVSNLLSQLPSLQDQFHHRHTQPLDPQGQLIMIMEQLALMEGGVFILGHGHQAAMATTLSEAASCST